MVSNVRASIGVGLLLGLTLSLLMWVSASPAQAQTVEGCQTEIAELRTATGSATFTGKNAAKDEAGLIGKLDNASLKLDEGKNADAVQKLTDFRNTVNSLAASGKIDPADAQILVEGSNDAIACIAAAGEPSPTAA